MMSHPMSNTPAILEYELESTQGFYRNFQATATRAQESNSFKK